MIAVAKLRLGFFPKIWIVMNLRDFPDFLQTEYLVIADGLEGGSGSSGLVNISKFAE
jgi:hypothetical protein